VTGQRTWRSPGLGGLALLTTGQRVAVALVLAITLGAALFSWWQVVRAGQVERQAQFDRAVDNWRASLQAALTERIGVLQGAAGFWRPLPEATREDWRSYLDGLSLQGRFPDIDAVTFTRYVPADERDAFERVFSATVAPDLRIHPRGDDTDAFVITHAEPHDRVRRILGFDIASEPRRRAAAERARDSGRPVMTEPLTLITAGNTSTDAILFMPVYRRFFPVETVEQKRRALRGWVTMGLHVTALLRDLHSQRAGEPLTLSVRPAASEEGEPPPLYAGPPPAPGALTSSRVVDVAGQTWLIDAASAGPGTGLLDGRQATTLVLAIALAVVLTAGVALLFVSRQQDRLLAARALADSEARYRAIIDGTAEGYWRIDPASGRTIEVNASLCAMLGYAREDILGRLPTEFGTEDGAAIMRDQMARLAETDHRLYDTMLRRKDGGILIAHFSATTLRDTEGRPQPAFAFVTDITERKRMERELLDKTAALETSNANLQQFAYVASHDLQAPLRTISSFLQLLERRYGPQLDDTAREYIGFAGDGAKRMSTLVHDLLLFSRVDTQGRALEPTDLGACVDTAIRNLTAAIASTGAEVRVDPRQPRHGPWVLGDPNQLTSLAQNLIENGLKYRRPDVPPVLLIGMENGGDTVRLSIADNGIGIPEQHHDRIFKIFQRLHTADEYDGTGIGLALCRRITDRHGGRIGVTSAAGQGTVFTVHLVAARQPAPVDLAP